MCKIIVLKKDDLEELLSKIIKKELNPILTFLKESKETKEDKLITRSELMAMLKCSSVKLHKMMKNQEIPYYKFGRNVYFKLGEVEKCLFHSRLSDKVFKNLKQLERL